MATDRPGRQRGFTLLEAIVVISITGIIAAMISTFIRAPVDAYSDTLRRGLLTDSADTALRRIARDVRTALPNSLRQPAGSSACLEFLPVVGGGRYRAEQNSGGTADILDFTTTDNSFDVLAMSGSAAAGNLVAIYNLGIPASGTSPGADAYAGDTTAAIGSTLPGNITLQSPGKKFPFASPRNRFQVIQNSAVIYAYDSANLRLVRFSQPISTTLSACPAIPANAAVLAGNVSSAAFSYLPAVTARSGLLTVQMALSSGGETVNLIHEIHVDNVP